MKESQSFPSMRWTLIILAAAALWACKKDAPKAEEQGMNQ